MMVTVTKQHTDFIIFLIWSWLNLTDGHTQTTSQQHVSGRTLTIDSDWISFRNPQTNKSWIL